MRSCIDFLSLPYQSRQGKFLERSPALPPGAVALLNFGDRLYIIGGRVFNNADLAMSVRWGDETIYLAFADGIDTRGGRVVADLLPGIYDIVKVDPFGGEIEQNVIVSNGYDLTPRTDHAFVQLVFIYPAGVLSLQELEDLIVPLNVRADWAVTDPESASYIQNKPAFITQDDLNIILATTINGIIEEEVEEQLAPVLVDVEAATTAASNATQTANDAAQSVSDLIASVDPEAIRVYARRRATALSE